KQDNLRAPTRLQGLTPEHYFLDQLIDCGEVRRVHWCPKRRLWLLGHCFGGQLTTAANKQSVSFPLARDIDFVELHRRRILSRKRARVSGAVVKNEMEHTGFEANGIAFNAESVG